MHAQKCSSLMYSFGYQVSKNKSFNFIIINFCVNWEKLKFITYAPMMVVGQNLSVFGNRKALNMVLRVGQERIVGLVAGVKEIMRRAQGGRL